MLNNYLFFSNPIKGVLTGLFVVMIEQAAEGRLTEAMTGLLNGDPNVAMMVGLFVGAVYGMVTYTAGRNGPPVRLLEIDHLFLMTLIVWAAIHFSIHTVSDGNERQSMQSFRL